MAISIAHCSPTSSTQAQSHTLPSGHRTLASPAGLYHPTLSCPLSRAVKDAPSAQGKRRAGAGMDIHTHMPQASAVSRLATLGSCSLGSAQWCCCSCLQRGGFSAQRLQRCSEGGRGTGASGRGRAVAEQSCRLGSAPNVCRDSLGIPIIP